MILMPSSPTGADTTTRTSATACLYCLGGSSETVNPTVVCCRLATALPALTRY